MHYQYCPAHDDWHIPCDCCGDGWSGDGDTIEKEYRSKEYFDELEYCSDPPPCGAYKNRLQWRLAVSKYEEQQALLEFPDLYNEWAE